VPYNHVVTVFDLGCTLIERALQGRRDILDDVSAARDFGKALVRLRDSMRGDVWSVPGHGSGPAAGADVRLNRYVARWDSRTRQDGFHVLHDWDGKAEKVNPDTIAVDVLNYLAQRRGAGPIDRVALAVLLDYYFVNLLALVSLRVWDEGDADANIDRLADLLRALQGPGGSGQLFAADAETLLLIATAHYEPHEWGYDRLLERVRTLNHTHKARIAMGHASAMGCHLRFGFEATYGRDTTVMRNDNVADYPWLCFALSTLMQEYARLREEGTEATARVRVVEALLNGLSADARAFVSNFPPGSLSACASERLEFRERFHGYKRDLLDELEPHRPTERGYSPLSFFFNFSHNVLKGTVVDALLRGQPWPLSLNDLLTGVPVESSVSKETLALTLMAYAQSAPDRIRGRLMPVIVYDPGAGRQAFGITMRKIKE
jgi:hypothetical protein